MLLSTRNDIHHCGNKDFPGIIYTPVIPGIIYTHVKDFQGIEDTFRDWEELQLFARNDIHPCENMDFPLVIDIPVSWL